MNRIERRAFLKTLLSYENPALRGAKSLEDLRGKVINKGYNIVSKEPDRISFLINGIKVSIIVSKSHFHPVLFYKEEAVLLPKRRLFDAESVLAHLEKAAKRLSGDNRLSLGCMKSNLAISLARLRTVLATNKRSPQVKPLFWKNEQVAPERNDKVMNRLHRIQDRHYQRDLAKELRSLIFSNPKTKNLTLLAIAQLFGWSRGSIQSLMSDTATMLPSIEKLEQALEIVKKL